MITTEQVAAVLSTGYGMEVDPAFLSDWVEMVNAIEPCLIGSGATEVVIRLILTNLVILNVWFSGGKRLNAVGSAAGSTVSFRYDNNLYSKLVNQIRLLDKNGCSASLIPADPNTTSSPIFDVVS